MLRQALKSCSHSKFDFFGCVLFKLVISHIKKLFSNSIAFSSWYHSVTSPLCFLSHYYVHPDLPLSSVYLTIFITLVFNFLTLNQQELHKTNLWITLCSSTVLRFFFCLLIQAHASRFCFTVFILWIQNLVCGCNWMTELQNSEKINCCCC